MNRPGVIIGIILAVAGVAAYFVFSSPISGRVHHILPLGGIGLAVLGALVVAGSAMMKPAGTLPKGQLKCEKCGMIFSSQSALDQHSKDKHGM